MDVQMIGERVLIAPEEQEEVSEGGIIIPETAREKPLLGVVRAVGPDVQAEISEGDRVLYGRYSGAEVSLDDESLLVLNETDVLARVTDD